MQNISLNFGIFKVLFFILLVLDWKRRTSIGYLITTCRNLCANDLCMACTLRKY